MSMEPLADSKRSFGSQIAIPLISSLSLTLKSCIATLHATILTPAFIASEYNAR